MSEREEGEFPRENGDHQSNGTGVGMGSDRAADRHPDVLDDLPSKSRSSISLQFCPYMFVLIVQKLVIYCISNVQESKLKS